MSQTTLLSSYIGSEYGFVKEIDMERYNISSIPANAETYFAPCEIRPHDLDNSTCVIRHFYQPSQPHKDGSSTTDIGIGV